MANNKNYKGALRLDWINKDFSLYYEIDENEGKGVRPTWVQKNDIRVAEPRILRFQRSYGEATSENMLIKGDNLLVLRSLVEMFKGKPDKEKVRCIYIDPPFNTGNAFKYYDDNLQHSEWLTMMRDRLRLLRELLRKDGAIFIHIDDTEIAYLIALGDEIFGMRNRLPIITIKRGSVTGPKVINPGFVNLSDYIVVYTRERALCKPNRVYRQKHRDLRYNKFILNRSSSPSQWKFINLFNAFADFKKTPVKELRKLQKINKSEIEKEIDAFVINKADSVMRTAALDNSKISEQAKRLKTLSIKSPNKIFVLKRDNYDTWYILNGERILFYSDRLSKIDGKLIPGELISNIWDDVLPNDLHNEGQVTFKKGKKPEKLIKRILELLTLEGDLVLDSFAGSGTTAAVAHKMGRRWITIEIGKQADNLIIPRLQRVIRGKDKSGISKELGRRKGGGFKYYHLGESLIYENDMNWSMKAEEMAEAVFLHFQYRPLKADWSEKENMYLGKHQSARYHFALSFASREIKTLKEDSYEKIVTELEKEKFKHLTIFTNVAVSVPPEALDDRVLVKKIPAAILREYNLL